MSSKVNGLPAYLKRFVVDQDYESYTSLEHASWRYIMRQSRAFFATHAVPIYSKGLKLTGIPIDRIPRISEMDEALSAYGWGAVGVEGFIPSSVFLDLLARGILPIALDMRTLAHLAYTPAPDIVHEAAGHAPIISDMHYRRFLERYSEIAYRAIISKDDIHLYECIRYLSDIKENPDTKPQEVARAEEKLKLAYASMRYLSEAGKVARLAWWTTEYGLVGRLEEPLIYGAALLSSVGESKTCMSSGVKKIPLSLDCLNYAYDITTQQPQLFVADSLRALPALIEELEKTFVFRLGGEQGLLEAKRAETVNTLALDSGISISGQLSGYEMSRQGQPEFVKFSGPVQITCEEKQLEGQGREQHPEGFSTPLGRVAAFPEKKLAKLTDKELRSLGLEVGVRAELDFISGIRVQGRVMHILRNNLGLQLIKWADCKVTKGEKIYFQPDWGPFDMVVGEKIDSVYCGPADRLTFGEYEVGKASSSPGRQSDFSQEELGEFKIYGVLRQLRQEKNPNNLALLESLSQKICREFPRRWLLGLEVLEIAVQQFGLHAKTTPWLKDLEECTFSANGLDEEERKLVRRGQEILSVED